MINNPNLPPIWNGRETRVSHTILLLLLWILLKHASTRVFRPRGRIQRIRDRQLQLAQAVIPIIGPRGAVNDELLARLGVRESLGSFVGREAHVHGPVV